MISMIEQAEWVQNFMISFVIHTMGRSKKIDYP